MEIKQGRNFPCIQYSVSRSITYCIGKITLPSAGVECVYIIIIHKYTYDLIDEINKTVTLNLHCKHGHAMCIC